MNERTVEIKAEDLHMTLEHLKQEGYAYLSFITAADYGDFLKVFYRLVNIDNGSSVIVEVELDGENAEIDSCANLFKGADWHEREVNDLLRIKFKGHPGLKRILLPDDFKGHPLRKNWSADDVERRPGDFV
jgi:NADH-quinone oxidoreductase subunit C